MLLLILTFVVEYCIQRLMYVNHTIIYWHKIVTFGKERFIITFAHLLWEWIQVSFGHTLLVHILGACDLEEWQNKYSTVETVIADDGSLEQECLQSLRIASMESKNTWVIRRQWLSRNTYVTNAKVVFSARERKKAKGNARCWKRTMTTIVPKNGGEWRQRNVTKISTYVCIISASRNLCFIVSINANKNCWKTMSTYAVVFFLNWWFFCLNKSTVDGI